MPENIFWLRLWQSVILGLFAIVACISACTVNSSRVVSELVKSGADPIKASCAVYGTSTTSCVASMIQKED